MSILSEKPNKRPRYMALSRTLFHKTEGRTRLKCSFLPALCMSLCALLASCSDDVQNEYSNLDAYFRFSPVTSVSPLYTALNSMGQFCTIRETSNQYLFNGPGGSANANKTTQNTYNPMRSIGGFIVGRANLTDMGSSTFPLLCFDLACPNCYDTYGIARALSIGETGVAECGRCHRSYDLNNGGIVSNGEAGKKLIRYHIDYSTVNDLLHIWN